MKNKSIRIGSNSKNYALFGAYGGVNAGDEMILRALVNLIRKTGNQKKISVIVGGKPTDTSLEIDYKQQGLEAVSYKSLKSYRSVLNRNLVIGGGQVLDGVAGIQLPILQIVFSLISKLSGGSVFIVGVGTARLENARVRFFYKLLFYLADAINVRDPGSHEDVLAISPACNDKLSYGSDLVFSMKKEILGDSIHSKKKYILFAIHSAPKLRITDSARVVELLTRISKLIAEKHSLGLIVHDRRAEFDGNLALDIVRLMKHKKVEILIPESTNDTISAYRDCQCIISYRMHPVIIGMCAGSYCIPLLSTKKLGELSSRFDLETLSIEQILDKSDDSLRAMLGVGLSSSKNYGAPLEQMEKLSTMAFEHE